MNGFAWIDFYSKFATALMSYTNDRFGFRAQSSLKTTARMF